MISPQTLVRIANPKSRRKSPPRLVFQFPQHTWPLPLIGQHARLGISRRSASVRVP